MPMLYFGGRPRTPVDMNTVRELSALGLGYKAIASELTRQGQPVSYSTIRRRLKNETAGIERIMKMMALSVRQPGLGRGVAIPGTIAKCRLRMFKMWILRLFSFSCLVWFSGLLLFFLARIDQYGSAVLVEPNRAILITEMVTLGAIIIISLLLFLAEIKRQWR